MSLWVKFTKTSQIYLWHFLQTDKYFKPFSKISNSPNIILVFNSMEILMTFLYFWYDDDSTMCHHETHSAFKIRMKQRKTFWITSAEKSIPSRQVTACFTMRTKSSRSKIDLMLRRKREMLYSFCISKSQVRLRFL